MPQLPQLISAQPNPPHPTPCWCCKRDPLWDSSSNTLASPHATTPVASGTLAILCLTHPFICEPQEKGSPLPSTRLSSPASMGRPKRVRCQGGICIAAQSELVLVKAALEKLNGSWLIGETPPTSSMRWRGRGADGTQNIRS